MSKVVVDGVPETYMNDVLCFDQLHVGSSMSVIIMVCRAWDCNNVNGRYISTDYIFSDKNEDSIHATTQSNIAYYFVDKLKEGGVYLLKNFTVLKNQPEFRILKESPYMIELQGSIVVKKVSRDHGGGGHVRVTLWGKLSDCFIAQKEKKAGVYTVILTSMSVKQYLGVLALSSSSSTLSVDNNSIPGIDFLCETQPTGEGPEPVTTIAGLLHSAHQDKKKVSTVFHSFIDFNLYFGIRCALHPSVYVCNRQWYLGIVC
ncbi:hypothetical protein SSX86_001816 [Deinandra increscens subsp. villosa]|uniref:Replication protein A 70 kDa DNA-binding subunit B/D first OB fold domain-containing protein n=1 Tax=Deinandra increscens subsp. villosa TaxID=3103831 RepID=A0AAP0DS39_9ASTR